jgi:hypothetical protein
MNYKIYITSNWGLDHEKFMNYLKKQTPGNKGVWDNIELTYKMEDADFIVVQDDSDQGIIDFKKVIFFGREPKHIKYRCWDKEKCFKVFHHENSNSWLPQTWWIGLIYDDLINLKYMKTRNLSIIDSGKKQRGGHITRFNFINSLIKKYPNEFDVFGKINGLILPERDKSKALLDYRYSLSIENGRTDYYFSEKFVDPILCLTMPIYYGCKKIDKFFPKGSYYNIDITKKGAEQEIYELINSDYAQENLEQLLEARDLVLNKYNIWPTIKMAIEDKRNNLLESDKIL